MSLAFRLHPAAAGVDAADSTMCVPSVHHTLDHRQVAVRVTRQQLPVALVQLPHGFRHAAVHLVHLCVSRVVLLHMRTHHENQPEPA